MDTGTVLKGLPDHFRNRIESTLEAIGIVSEIKNRRVIASLLPSAGRGFLLQQGKSGDAVKMKSHHETYFDFSYRSDFPEMVDLYKRAKLGQWNSDTALDWSTDVDPLNPEVPLLPDSFFPLDGVSEYRHKLDGKELMRFKHSFTSWMLSQFLHGEQGALFAAAQVTESVQWMDGKFYGATQVMDEGRHVEVFHRYVETKMNKLYQINDSLFTIIDSLMTDSRWDMKFLGMQIMIEGLALGAFGTLYRNTREPLLKEMLRYVIQDEARHVHYGVLALHEQFTKHITEKERRDREEWAFELALLMRNRFMAHEVYEEWFGGVMTRKQWNELVMNAPGMADFRHVMFSRLMPNLKHIGLLSPRIQQHYENAGLMKFAGGKNASQLTAEDLLTNLDTTPPLQKAS